MAVDMLLEMADWKGDVAGSGSEGAATSPCELEPVCLRLSNFVAVGTLCAWTE